MRYPISVLHPISVLFLFCSSQSRKHVVKASKKSKKISRPFFSVNNLALGKRQTKEEGKKTTQEMKIPWVGCNQGQEALLLQSRVSFLTHTAE